MIKEDYVSFEIAKLLKEKGFDEDINLWYDETGEMFFELKYNIGRNWRVRNNQKVYECPTLHMAMKWLRDVHGVHLALFPYDVENGAVRYLPEILIISNGTQQLEYVEGLNICESYEQAAEAAIKYCLENLI